MWRQPISAQGNHTANRTGSQQATQTDSWMDRQADSKLTTQHFMQTSHHVLRARNKGISDISTPLKHEGETDGQRDRHFIRDRPMPPAVLTQTETRAPAAMLCSSGVTTGESVPHTQRHR